jgi:DNA-binding NarL/FixJ family response regulator
MKPLNAVVVQHNDGKAVDCLVKSLHTHFRSVHTAHDVSELRQMIAMEHADVAIVDLELVSLIQLRELIRDHAAATVICTHRLADENLWTQALAAGAADCCYNSDIRAIVLAAARHASAPHAA